MIMRILTSLTILLFVSSFIPDVPKAIWRNGQYLILVTVLYRIYDYIAVQHWEWVLPFFLLILVFNPFFSIPFHTLSYGKFLYPVLRATAAIFLGYSLKHIS